RVLLDVCEGDELDRITALDRRGHFGKVAPRGSWPYLDVAVTRRVERVVLCERERAAVGDDRGRTRRRDEAGFMRASGEGHRGITRVQDDAAVVQVHGRRRTRRHGACASTPRGGVAHHAAFESQGIASDGGVHRRVLSLFTRY